MISLPGIDVNEMCPNDCTFPYVRCLSKRQSKRLRLSRGVSFACRVSSSGIDLCRHGAHPSQSKTHLRDFQRLSARCVTNKYVGNNTRVASQLCICNLIYACIYWYRMHLTLRWKAGRRNPTAGSLIQFTHCTL